jgi:hypothetical protein
MSTKTVASRSKDKKVYTDIDAFLKRIKAKYKGKRRPPFQPCAFYSKDGGFVEVCWDKDANYRHHISQALSVLISLRTGGIVVIVMGRVKELMQKGNVTLGLEPALPPRVKTPRRSRR